MEKVTGFTKEHIGKYFLIFLGKGHSLPVQLISVGNGLCGWISIDPDSKLRSGKIKINDNEPVAVYNDKEGVIEVWKLVTNPNWGL